MAKRKNPPVNAVGTTVGTIRNQLGTLKGAQLVSNSPHGRAHCINRWVLSLRHASIVPYLIRSECK